jgi:hypothetical protein
MREHQVLNTEQSSVSGTHAHYTKHWSPEEAHLGDIWVTSW